MPTEQTERIEITGGYVEISSIVRRKAKKAFQKTLLTGTKRNAAISDKSDEENENEVDIDLGLMGDASDALVLNMIEKANINSEYVDVNQKFIDDLPGDDFDKIFVACSAKMKSKEEEKKS